MSRHFSFVARLLALAGAGLCLLGGTGVAEEPQGRLQEQAKPHGEELSPTPLGQVTLIAPAHAVAGGTATVSFNVASLVPSGSDPFWLDLYAPGTSSGEPLTRSPVPYGARTAVVALPSRPGSYEIRLMSGASPKPTSVPPITVELDERPAPTSASAISAKLERAEVTVGEAVVLRFGAPLVPLPDEQYWVTLVEASAADDAYATWAYVDVGGRSVSLDAPMTPGHYEMRLHSRYPTLDKNLVFRAKLEVVADPKAPVPTDPTRLTVRLERTTTRIGGDVVVLFDPPLVPQPGEQYWITVVLPSTEDGAWGHWKYVALGAAREALSAPDAPGRYELRLHARYPTYTTNVIWRASFEVE